MPSRAEPDLQGSGHGHRQLHESQSQMAGSMSLQHSEAHTFDRSARSTPPLSATDQVATIRDQVGLLQDELQLYATSTTEIESQLRAASAGLERRMAVNEAVKDELTQSVAAMGGAIEELKADVASSTASRTKQEGAMKQLNKQVTDRLGSVEDRLKKVSDAISNSSKRMDADAQMFQNEVRTLSRQLEETNKRSMLAASKVEYMASEAGKRTTRGPNGDYKARYGNKSSGLFYQIVGYAVKGFYSPMFLLYETITALSLVDRLVVLISGRRDPPSGGRADGPAHHWNPKADSLDNSTDRLAASVSPTVSGARAGADDSDADTYRVDAPTMRPCLLDSLDQHGGLSRSVRRTAAGRRAANGK